MKKRNAINGFFTEEEVSTIEAQNPDGLSSAEIIEICSKRNIKLSEATFRKYVQLGFLPRSRRIGTKGKHKGSRGIYPAGTVRQIVDIKRMMALDYTIEEIQQHFVFVGGEIEALRTLLYRIFDQLEKSSASEGERDVLADTDIRRQIAEARDLAENLVAKLERTAKGIRQRKQTAREAV
jgi:CRISPR type IV-associated protein Csf3